MSKHYILHRCGLKIKIEKQAEYFTAILPKNDLVHQVDKMAEIQQVKQVFNNIYKIKTKEAERDGIMDHLRSNMKTKAIFHHAYTPPGEETTRYYITEMIVVTFKPKTKNSIIEKVMKQHGIQLVKQYRNLPDTYLFKVTSSAGKNPVKVAIELSERKEVVYAEPNLINRFANAYTPTDDLFKKQWHLKSSKGIELVANADVSAPKAWDMTKGSRDIVVAVIDDGFDLYHPDLSGSGKIIDPKDFSDGDNIPFPRKTQNDYHGTPCAGVAIGEENGEGIVGVAPGCAFLPIRFDLAADDNLLWEIFDYASSRAHVISCSWGPVPVYAPLNSLLYNKFSEITKSGGPNGKGCSIVFAAGNFNAPLKDMKNKAFQWFHPNHGIITTRQAILNGNAAHPDVLAVSASTSQNRKSAYSNWGKEITVCAPSDNWHPIEQQAFVPGRGVWTTDNETYGTGFTNNSRYTGNFGGTSSATPLVAGVVGLLRSINPDLNHKQLMQILKETSDKIEDNEADIVLGNQKGTYSTKGHSEWFGYGKINAAKAVAMAKSMIPKPKTPTPEPAPEPIPTPTVSTSSSEGLFIIAALVNPKGKESGAEKISLFNVSNQAIDLNGWRLDTDKKSKEIISDQIIASGGFLIINLSKLRLSNSGGKIRLLDTKQKVVHEVSYTKAQAKREGWHLKF